MTSGPYTVHIYESEATLISRWTLEYPDIETGGDLFGLWLSANEIGPGQKCRRTVTSFFQDEQYLNGVGGLLIRDHGLCRVGSWHSHHTMNLPDPSRGDKDTVWKHLPTPGRFVLLIAAIKTEAGAAKVEMGFNLFESTTDENQMTPMKLNILQGESPIQANKAISSKILEGAELHSKKPSYPETASPIRQEVNKQTRAEGQEVAQPDMKSNAKPDVSSFFNKGKQREPGPRGHRQPLNHQVTCDGLRMSGDTFQGYYTMNVLLPRTHHYSRQYRHPYTYSVRELPDGRESITLYHKGHSLGQCEDCYHTTARLTKSGKLRVVHGQGDDCCSCSIV